MGVTPEPPWVNNASGTAARNGTTSHTISFGFTSTSGNLLVVFIHGAVTHTVSGWTKQAGPIATGECAMFTKTSAGDSSITVTHNGSNYPVNWAAYEFETGSTITGVDSTTGSNDTMVALTGLPGTEQVILGALGRVTIGSETSATISPSSPWVEDADLFAAASGTDGSYLAVVHQINVTATSITPTITPTYNGTWSNGNREKISAAINAVAPSGGTSAVSGSIDFRWQVRNTVTGTFDSRWQVRNTVTGSVDFRWQVKQIVTGALDLRWAVKNAVSGTLDARWAVLESVSGSIDFRWTVRERVTGSLDLRWVSAGTVSGSIDFRWNVRQVVSGTLDLRWAVRSQISGSLDLRWTSRARATGSLDLRWVVESDEAAIPTTIRAYLTEHVTADLRRADVVAYLTER